MKELRKGWQIALEVSAMFLICFVCTYNWDMESQAEAAPVIAEIEEVQPSQTDKLYLGKFTVTAYCSCEKCCGKWSNPEDPRTASGAPATEGITVGADWGMIPPGTVIQINGVGIRIVEDKPADWIVDRYDGMVLDLYFDEHDDALAFGKQELDVWVIE